LEHTSDNLLLLAYTNRAVDEICEALDSLGGNIREQYLRIGSRFSTAPAFREQLLNHNIGDVSTRAELRSKLESRRIFVSTVASFAQNEALLKLKTFQRLVVDEASQLLEPQILGLLTRFNHFVLIGDHRQLPAVSAQGPERTEVTDPGLNAIGLADLRDSYFERLYRRCETLGMTAHYGRLSRQGRMHEAIMAFPNAHFYQHLLKTLNEQGGQHGPCAYVLPGDETDLEKSLANARVAFVPSAPETFVPGQKTHRGEAELTAQLVRFFRRLYEANGLPWEPSKTLGIITPWRAQIAQIRAALSACGENPDAITIDTVERYQGGAREIILISTAVHTEGQLAALVNLSGEGVDRKLNVALTRARKHVVLLGKAEVLEKDPRYKAFMENYGV
jgi:DNA replication ATP-dependent helicase Dna2